MATIEELQAMLDEAIAARHALAIGKAKVSIRYGDRQIDYTRATLADLNAYIDDLQRQLNPSTSRKRVIRFTQTGTGL